MHDNNKLFFDIKDIRINTKMFCLIMITFIALKKGYSGFGITNITRWLKLISAILLDLL